MVAALSEKKQDAATGVVAASDGSASAEKNGLWARLLWLPRRLARWRHFRQQAALAKAELDHELRLYAEMFPNDFLHYGYFDNTQLQGSDISFAQLEHAQTAYAEHLVDLIRLPQHPVLDVGCGMGGLSFMLDDQGIEVLPLTPDRHQVAHISNKRPHLKVIHNRFEDFVAAGYEEYFGTVITSESLQYLDLDRAVPRIRGLLKSGGRWIVCDYFRLEDGEKTSGHVLEDFKQRINEAGFDVTHEQDITANVLPTLRFASMLARRFVQPVVRYSENKLLSKRPFIYAFLESVFKRLHGKMDKGMASIDPEQFAANKRYIRMVIEPLEG